MPIVPIITPVVTSGSGVPRPQAMDRGQIRDEVRLFLMNTNNDSASYTWGDDELNSYIDEANYYSSLITEYTQEAVNVTMITGQTDYDMPAENQQIQRLTMDRLFLPQTTLYDLDRFRNNWRDNPPAQPQRAYMNLDWDGLSMWPTPNKDGVFYQFQSEVGIPLYFTEDDGTTIDSTFTFTSEFGVPLSFSDTLGAIIRTQADLATNPSSDISNELGTWIAYSTDQGNLGVTYNVIPAEFTSDFDVPQCPAQVHYALVFYTLMKCYTRDGEFQDLDAAQDWWALYMDWMDAVLQAKARQWPDRLESIDPYAPGNLFRARLETIGPPTVFNVSTNA